MKGIRRTIVFALAVSAAAVMGPVAMEAQSKKLTVKEFKRLSQSDTTSYVVEGVVSKIFNTNRGSFNLTDRTGTIFIYGLSFPGKPELTFRQMDIAQGDTVSVLGRFTIYNGTTKEMKDGRLLSKSNGPDHDTPLIDRLEHKPRFKGKEGQEALEEFSKWVHQHIVPPENGEKGKVQVGFVIGRNGGVQEVQVLKGASPALNEEAVRVVKSSPKWKPAQMDGQKLRTPAHITVVFK